MHGVFYELLLANNVPKEKAIPMYLGVYLGGWLFYKTDSKASAMSCKTSHK